ncbi:unnamed protein product [Gongylonema pulchrum]|uniref:BRICK1 n=1 Tax=Gongylonema pulchrum TaxID=637853 RepID=A0A183E8Q2_9BILA|nr:unnamed protein product [Gongylonema pulchrum]
MPLPSLSGNEKNHQDNRHSAANLHDAQRNCRRPMRSDGRKRFIRWSFSGCWMNAGASSVQRQLKEDWDNRSYAQEISDNIRHTADFLSNFELSCRSKIAALSDKISLLERKVEFLEARVSCLRKGFLVASTLHDSGHGLNSPYLSCAFINQQLKN